MVQELYRMTRLIDELVGGAPVLQCPQKKGKLTKSGIPGWFLNKIGYLFSRGGARLRTSAKRLQNAFWRLNPLRLVCAQHPKNRFFGVRPLKTASMTGPKKCSPRTTRFCSGTHRVYPALFFDFINHPILFILHPILFTLARPAETRKRTSPRNPARKIPTHNWQVADCDATAAALTSRPTKIRRDG